MTAAKHTPGPWTLVEDPNVGTFFVAPSMQDGLTDLEGRFFNSADAALIAAAPDLLKALRRIEFALSLRVKAVRNHEGYPLVEIARAAIAKATGGAA